MAVSMSTVRKIRNDILDGKQVKDLAEKYNVSPNIVRNYTKAERLRVKKENEKLERMHGVSV